MGDKKWRVAFFEISAQVSESKLLFLLCVDLSAHVSYVG